MKSLYLAWRAPNRAWFPIGLLEAQADDFYAFRYTKGALHAKKAVGFEPLVSFPDFDRRYESSELFPLFRNRVLDPHRRDFSDYLRSLDLEPSKKNPIEILSVTGGTRETDAFEVFPKIQKEVDHSFSCRFFMHGLRHLPEQSQTRASRLEPTEELGISVEISNPVTTYAIQLTSRDNWFLGWAPRYLVFDLIRAVAGGSQMRASVIRVNAFDVPSNRRILVELRGKFPENVEPMSGEEFQPIVPEILSNEISNSPLSSRGAPQV